VSSVPVLTKIYDNNSKHSALDDKCIMHTNFFDDIRSFQQYQTVDIKYDMAKPKSADEVSRQSRVFRRKKHGSLVKPKVSRQSRFLRRRKRESRLFQRKSRQSRVFSSKKHGSLVKPKVSRQGAGPDKKNEMKISKVTCIQYDQANMNGPALYFCCHCEHLWKLET